METPEIARLRACILQRARRVESQRQNLVALTGNLRLREVAENLLFEMERRLEIDRHRLDRLIDN
jgi:hypothetical protein